MKLGEAVGRNPNEFQPLKTGLEYLLSLLLYEHLDRRTIRSSKSGFAVFEPVREHQ